jgi:tetratricopeptide (TPR) repeat protein
MTPLAGRHVPALVRMAGLAVSSTSLAFVLWLLITQPRTVEEITGGVTASVGAYRIDAAHFAEGRRFFLDGQYPEARAAFGRADPAQRDAVTQFYVAYTYYRQGWGRVYHDDELYAAGLAALDRAVSMAPDGRVRVDDPELAIASADELKVELEQGLRRDLSDFNPFKVFRQRK